MNKLTIHRLLRPLLGVAMATNLSTGLIAGEVQQAGCNCQNGGGGAQYIDSAPIDGYLSDGPTFQGDIGPPVQDSYSGDAVGNGQSSIYESMTAPPPGTLGQTYQLSSRPVPADKHPRVGMIDVNAPSATFVIVRWTNDFRTDETLKGYQDDADPSIWHFESKPLLPGLKHIHRVEIYNGGPGSAATDVRYVRLIMGRIVNLTI
ncbi:MAG: hypothetical protein KDA93_11935 [Planctomycetaceae bacterium]|nr:hypothetical protein [Planctomycetaceae bacterium]